MLLKQVKNALEPLANKKIAVLVSGGVDSCVASLLLKQNAPRSTSFVGVFMKNWEDDEQDERCRSKYEDDRADAKFVCEKLDIEFREVNFVKEYWHHVFVNFMQDYERGWTPNPDILCNRRIKFGACLDHVTNHVKSSLIATGHYAGSSNGPFFENGSESECSGVKLFRAKDELKDQTFFLSQVHQESLQKVIFPLQHFTKAHVRKIAIENGFERISTRKSSKGICFIGKRNYQQFIEKYMQPRPGQFVDLDTNHIVGQHKGFHYWTVGQHARIHTHSYKTKYYVARKSNPDQNIIYVVNSSNHPALFSDHFTASNSHWIDKEPEQLSEHGELSCLYKFQQKDKLVPCKVQKVNDGTLVVNLPVKQRAITPGQYAVFYLNDCCLGSARISAVS